MTDRELVDLAFTMLERSYVPYSHFPVGPAGLQLLPQAVKSLHFCLLS